MPRPHDSGDKIKTWTMNDCDSHLCHHCSLSTPRASVMADPEEMVAGGSQGRSQQT